MDISWNPSVSWITRQLTHSLWASGHLRGDRGEGPGGNKKSQGPKLPEVSSKPNHEDGFITEWFTHESYMIIALVAIRTMLRDTCFRWISNTSWMERWMCSMVAAASGSLQWLQCSLQTSILIVLVWTCDTNTSAILESLMIWMTHTLETSFSQNLVLHGVTASRMWPKVPLYN